VSMNCCQFPAKHSVMVILGNAGSISKVSVTQGPPKFLGIACKQSDQSTNTVSL
jgi:hypothetical protein